MKVVEYIDCYTYDSSFGYYRVNKYDPIILHCQHRINDALDKAKKKENFEQEFDKLMLTRLIRMKKVEKIIYSLILLYVSGYREMAERYETKLLLNELKED